MTKYKIGYTQGVYDMFHIGHLNILKRAKEQCDYLIVGVNSDKLVQEYKNKIPVINEMDRLEIIKNIKSVDEVVLAETLDKEEMYKRLKFDAIFIGDDWKGSLRWENTKTEMEKLGVDLVYLPYTQGINSTMLRTVKDEQINDE